MKMFLAMAVMAAVLLTAACPGKMRRAVDASARLSAQIHNLQQQVERSYDDGLIDRDFAMDVTVLIRDKMIPAARDYTTFVDELRQRYPKGSGEKPGVSQWAVAKALFYAVETPFRDILVRVGKLTAEQSAYISVAIAAIAELVQIISAAFASAQHAGGVRWQTSLT